MDVADLPSAELVTSLDPVEEGVTMSVDSVCWTVVVSKGSTILVVLGLET